MAELDSAAGIYLFKVNNSNTKAMPKICSKLIKKTLDMSLIVNFEQISLIVLGFSLLTLNKEIPAWQPLIIINIVKM